MQINLNASFMVTQACIPLLKQETHSAIVFTLDDKNTAYWGAYGVAKAGLTTFMNILADELDTTSINVTGINPGPIHTNFRTRAFPGENPNTLKKPAEVAKVAALLISETGVSINGTATHGRTFQLSDFATEKPVTS
jgi:NAD(P)-dependent dehydrogenase (short-subunit alcohol dehydrogenase family)